MVTAFLWSLQKGVVWGLKAVKKQGVPSSSSGSQSSSVTKLFESYDFFLGLPWGFKEINVRAVFGGRATRGLELPSRCVPSEFRQPKSEISRNVVFALPFPQI